MTFNILIFKVQKTYPTLKIKKVELLLHELGQNLGTLYTGTLLHCLIWSNGCLQILRFVMVCTAIINDVILGIFSNNLIHNFVETLSLNKQGT